MKPNKYILVVTACVAFIPAVYSTNSFTGRVLSSMKAPDACLIRAKSPLPAAMAVEAQKNAEWLPGTAVRTDWDGMEWVPYGKYNFKYDSEGRTVEELSESLDTSGKYVKFTKRVYTYDALGRLSHTSLLAGDTPESLTELQKADLKYDEVITDLVICQDSYSFFDNEWILDDQSYKRNIIRDTDGNITEMTAQTYYEGDFLDVENLTIIYEGGVPSIIKERVLTQNESTGELKLELTEEYSDCEWYFTDGQLVSLDDITVGKNHLKSAKVVTADVKDMTMEIVYKDDSDDYTSTAKATLLYIVPTITVTEYSKLPYGGTFQKITQDMDIPQYGKAIKIMTLDNQFDAWGNLIISKQVTTYGATTIDKWVQGEFVNDETYGYPLQYLQKEFFQYQGQETGEWEDKYKLEFADYVNPYAGVEEIKTPDTSDLIPEYYTIDGRRVASDRLFPGIYIKRQGNKSEKVIIR